MSFNFDIAASKKKMTRNKLKRWAKKKRVILSLLSDKIYISKGLVMAKQESERLMALVSDGKYTS